MANLGDDFEIVGYSYAGYDNWHELSLNDEGHSGFREDLTLIDEIVVYDKELDQYWTLFDISGFELEELEALIDEYEEQYG